MTANTPKKSKTASKRTTKPTRPTSKRKPVKDTAPAIGADPERSEPNGSAPLGNGTLPAVAEAQPNPSKPPVEKDELGRFLPGNNGGPGRPLGSRNRLVEDFLSDFHEAWKANGADALKKMVAEEPAAFVRAAVQLMPKDVLVEARGAGLVVVKLGDEDLAL